MSRPTSKHRTSPRQRRGSRFLLRRTAFVLVVVAIMLPVLFGSLGIVVDVGIMMAVHRQTRNAADAAALAAAMDLVRGRSATVASATALTYVREYNTLPQANVSVHIPPASGPYVGNHRYAEVLVNRPIATTFIQMLGVNRDQTVLGRSVAGYKSVDIGARVLTLNPDARPGLKLGGNGTISVNGVVAVNSQGGGVNENWEATGGNGTAATVSNNATLRATGIRVAGGVNNPNNFRHYDQSLTGSPLKAGIAPQPDPFMFLPPPTTANGAVATEWPAVHVNGNNSVTLEPGVYPSIRVSSGNITFNPGIYIIRGGEFRVTNPGSVGNGVMFYLTGEDYNVNTGLPDRNDLESLPPLAGNTKLASATINAGLQLSGITDPNSPFHGMLFYQRRLNTEEFRIQGNGTVGAVAGTLYAKWADVKIAGNGTYHAQFVVGSIETTGNGNITIDDGSVPYAQTEKVFLVE